MDSEKIEEAAAQWLVRRSSEGWSETDEAQLDAWLAQRDAHRIAFIRLDAAWKRAARLTVLGAGLPSGVIPPPGFLADTRLGLGTNLARATAAIPAKRTRRVRRSLIALAAGAFACAVGLQIYTSGILTQDRYTTSVGDLDIVPLADGSHVTLNTNTAIRIALERDERRIELSRGEAFFDVAKDPARPFIVVAGEKRVVAVGTQFAVRRDGDDVRVVVSEGKVLVEDASDTARVPRANPQKEPRLNTGATAEILLSAGNIARATRSEVLVDERAAGEVERLLGWRAGKVFFKDTSLADAIAEINRYTTRKIVIEDPEIAGIVIGGTFRTNNVDTFLWLLRSGFPIEVEQSEQRIVLRRR